MVSILAIGCQNTAQQRPLEPNRNNNVTPRQSDQTPNMTGNLSDSEMRAMAKRLSNLAEEVEGVDDASVLISDMGTTGLGNNAGNNNMPNQGLGTGTGENNMGNTDLRNNTGNNNNMGMGNTGLRDNMDTNMGNNGTMNGNMNGNVGRTNNGGLSGITENINNVNNRTTNNTNMNNNNGRGLVVMVGLDLKDNFKNNATNMDRIQREVANRIKASDNRIMQVYVTTDENMVDRIEDVADDIVDGGTLNTLRNDINNIYRDLIGQGPAF